jgi:hypothetical protein
MVSITEKLGSAEEDTDSSNSGNTFCEFSTA